jgi:hypothetical protein
MTKQIKAMYKKAGVRAPNGKGVHTKAFHSRATKIMQSGTPRTTAYATAMKQLGRNKAVKKSHWQKGYKNALKSVFKK